MKLRALVAMACDKQKFETLQQYLDFARSFLDFCEKGLQATIVSQNEPKYQFFQFREEGSFNVSRPINSQLMLRADSADELTRLLPLLRSAKVESGQRTDENGALLCRAIYTLQQSIGVALDALPANQSNTARKINGDLFERLIQLMFRELRVECTTGTVRVPVVVDGVEQFKMSYQHDLLLLREGELKVIGSVKTSSKDRIDKIFLDKFLYSKLTDTSLPHIAIFLNDVQRKATRNEQEYGVNSTFLTGHFKGLTIKLNPLDGVYYCDIRPIMRSDALLANHIATIDQLFFQDIWRLLSSDPEKAEQVEIEPEE